MNWIGFGVVVLIALGAIGGLLGYVRVGIRKRDD